MKTKQRDPNEPFVFTSTPPESADTILTSKIVLEDGIEKAVVEELKRDFHDLDGMRTRDYSIAVLQRTNPAALAMCDKKLTRDRIGQVQNLENQVAASSQPNTRVCFGARFVFPVISAIII